jgi:hypothetical protein
VVAIERGEALGDDRDLKRARNPQHVDILIADAVSDKPIDGAFEEALGDKPVKATDHDAKMKALAP